MGGFDRTGRPSQSKEETAGSPTPGTPGKRTLVEAASPAITGKGSGAPVAPEVRAAVEPVVGRAFPDVRVHEDASAATAAQQLGARAFAFGPDVFLGRGESPTDKQLMAHELTHVAQQDGAVRTKIAVGGDGDAAEREADAVADRVASGSTARMAISQGAAVVRRALAKDHQEATDAANQPLPGWTKPEIESIQNQLIRLGLYTLTADGDLGARTQSALVEAFGSDEWRTMDAATCLGRLKAAKPSAAGGAKPGQHELRLGEMFKDGVLDMTVALGFDEGGANKPALKNLTDALAANHFTLDSKVAAELYKQAGRTPGGIGDFYVRKDALTYQPPAGTARKIHAVVRLVYSLDGSKGKEVAAAFKEGMVQSDVAYYTGHGRYGSGPDFDRNFTIDLLNADGSVDRTFDQYQDAEVALAKEGKPAGRSAWQQFLWRVDKKTIRVNGSNDGNVVLNTNNPHGGEFGGNLMYWNLTRNGTPPPKVTGPGNELGNAADKATDRKYRVVVFDGCRSVDYEKQLRKTDGFDTKQSDMFGSSVELNWGDEGKTLAAFLDSIIQMQSAEQIATNMDKQQSVGTGSYHAYGVDDNPVVK
jgi:hypothetical protein